MREWREGYELRLATLLYTIANSLQNFGGYIIELMIEHIHGMGDI
jgi:hypothetical protein